MMEWLLYLAQFLPLVLVVSFVCAGMKEDQIGRIVARGLRISATLTAGTVGFCVAIYLLIVLFL